VWPLKKKDAILFFYQTRVLLGRILIIDPLSDKGYFYQFLILEEIVGKKTCTGAITIMEGNIFAL